MRRRDLARYVDERRVEPTLRDILAELKVGDRIQVKVIRIDGERRRIGLSLKGAS